MKELAKPGYYVRTFDRDIFLTEAQRDTLYRAMDLGKTYFDIGGSRVMMSQVKEVVASPEYERSVVGGYYCPKHPSNFVPKGKVCGYC